MRTITKKIISLLLILCIVLLFSSCLESSQGSWSVNEDYSYITKDDATNTVYARTTSPYMYLITSQRIQSLNPGTVASISYQIDFDEDKPIMIGEDKKTPVFKASLTNDPRVLEQTVLQSITPPKTDTMYFENISNPPTWMTDLSEYIGDRLPVTYQYKAKKGENMVINFYNVPESKFPENFNADVLIDIRIEKDGEAEKGVKDEIIDRLIIADMSSLRMTPTDVDNKNNKRLNVKFRYFRSDKEGELYISDQPFMITVQK